MTPDNTEGTESSGMLVTVYFEGTDNGVPKTGIRSISFNGPAVKSPEELQEVVDAVALVIRDELKYENLQVAVVNVLRYPF